VLALSPFCSPFVLKGDLAEMNVPVMYQGGTRDLGVTPTVKRLNGAYDHSSAPKYLRRIRRRRTPGVDNLKTDYQEIIDRYSVAFFNHYLRAKDGTLDELDSLNRECKANGSELFKSGCEAVRESELLRSGTDAERLRQAVERRLNALQFAQRGVIPLFETFPGRR